MAEERIAEKRLESLKFQLKRIISSLQVKRLRESDFGEARSAAGTSVGRGKPGKTTRSGLSVAIVIDMGDFGPRQAR